METLLYILDRPVIHCGNMAKVSARKWASLLAELLAELLAGEPAVRMPTPRQTWRTVRTVADLQAHVRDGGKVW